MPSLRVELNAEKAKWDLREEDAGFLIDPTPTDIDLRKDTSSRSELTPHGG